VGDAWVAWTTPQADDVTECREWAVGWEPNHRADSTTEVAAERTEVVFRRSESKRNEDVSAGPGYRVKRRGYRSSASTRIST
jgi:hypothetical protein